MTQSLGPVKQVFVLPIGPGGAPVPWRYMSSMGHEAEFQDATDTPVLSATFGVDYTITPEGDTPANSGTLTLLLPAPLTATKLVVWRRTPKVQNYAATPGAEGVEAQLDRLTLALQEAEDGTGASAVSLIEKLYLGALAADPTTDLQGNALLTGAQYWNTVALAMRVFNGTIWVTVSGSGAQTADPILTALAGLSVIANRGLYGNGTDSLALYVLTAFGRDLSGVADDVAARTLLGLGSVAVQNLIALAQMDPALIRTALGGGIALDKTADDELTTVKTVADYVDARSGRILLATRVASNSPNLNFTELNNFIYSEYELDFEDLLVAVDGTRVVLLTSSNAGASYDAGPTDYDYANMFIESGADPANDTTLGASALHLVGASVGLGNAAGELGINGTIRILNAMRAASKTTVMGHLSASTSAGRLVNSLISGRRLLAQDTDALRIRAITGNLLSGTVRLFGKI